MDKRSNIDATARIDSSAEIDPTAKIGANVTIAADTIIGPGVTVGANVTIAANTTIGPEVSIGSNTLIGPEVEIGSKTWIGPLVVIEGPTRIGEENKFFQFASIGAPPQDKRYNGEPTRLEIGDRNLFRECSTVHRGTVQGRGLTKIGDDNFFMNYTHVAHDCEVGNQIVFANNASIAGHVTIGDYATLAGMVGIHQFCHMGAYSFAAGGAVVLKDIPPFVTVFGYPAEAHGLNTVGLERRGFTSEKLSILRKAYKIIYRQTLTLKEAIEELKTLVNDASEVQLLIDFLQNTKRGIVR